MADKAKETPATVPTIDKVQAEPKKAPSLAIDQDAGTPISKPQIDQTTGKVIENKPTVLNSQLPQTAPEPKGKNLGLKYDAAFKSLVPDFGEGLARQAGTGITWEEMQKQQGKVVKSK